MKTTFYIGALSIVFIFLFIRGSVLKEKSSRALRAPGFEYPAKVKAVIDQKCYGCHSTDGKSAEAKEGLLWDSIPDYSKVKLVAKLDDIIGVLDDGAMPPEEFVKEHPEAKLTKEEKGILKSWAEESADNLMK